MHISGILLLINDRGVFQEYANELQTVLNLLRALFRSNTKLPHHTTMVIDDWPAYWKAQRQPWRTEPEIGKKRQKKLARCCTTVPDIERGIYPFKGMKLSRADVEWLLVMHENGCGPVDWNDENQRKREGLDMRGADLREVDLRNLPLARMCGGLTADKWLSATSEQRNMGAIHLEGADLTGAHLEGAFLGDAHLQEADLEDAHLQEADLEDAHLQGAFLLGAHLERVHFNGAHLDGVNLKYAHLKGANLSRVHLNEADLRWADLEGAHLIVAHLEEANLSYTHLQRANLSRAHLGSTNLEKAILNDEKHRGPKLADVQWGGVNLTVVEWSKVNMLGDEYEARQKKRAGRLKDRATRLDEYEAAVRANRQLAVVLQNQGLNEDAARFVYRAQRLQRVVLRRQRKFGQYFFSLFLSLIAGYGYRLWRSFATYVLVIVGFATAYYLLGPTMKLSLSPLDAIIFSVTSFHGRGFSPAENIGLSNPLTILAATEAFVGLIVEVTLIATLTQRFFGK